MTNPAHNALHDVHLFDHLAEKHRNRVRQAAQQSDAEGGPAVCISFFGWDYGRAMTSAAKAHREEGIRIAEDARRQEAEAQAELASNIRACSATPDVEDAIWHEISKLVPVPIGALGEGEPRLTAQAVSEPSPSV